MEGLSIIEASGLRTVPRLGELPSPGFEEEVAPEYASSPGLVAFLFGSGAATTSFPLGLSMALPFLLGELEGPLGIFHQSLPFAKVGPAIEAPLLDFFTFLLSFLRLILFDIAAK